MKKWLAMVLVACLAGSASAAEYSWWGSSFVADPGDGVSFNDVKNWASPWAVQATVLPGGDDLVKIQGTSWMTPGYPVLTGSAVVGGLQVGLDTDTYVTDASLEITASGSLTSVTNSSLTEPHNPGIQIGWYSDGAITSAGTVDSGTGGTLMGLGNPTLGYGNATLSITAGSWTTPYVSFGSSNSVNTIQVDGGTLTAGDIFFDPASNGINHVQIDGGTVEILAAAIGHIEKENQTIDITGGTLLLHSEDAGLIVFYQTVGLTGYGSGANISAVHSDTDADTINDLWTVTATLPLGTNYTWWGLGFGGDGVTFNSISNWANPAPAPIYNVQATVLPGVSDVIDVMGMSWIADYPTLSGSANVAGLFVGLDNATHTNDASITISATGSLNTHGDDGWNDGIQIGFYSDGLVTSAGAVSTLDTHGDGSTALGAGSLAEGYGNGTLNITGGTWDTPSVIFLDLTTNHVQLSGGTLTTWDLNGLHNTNQTMDITGGTLVFHSTDAAWFGWIKTLGLTGYGSADNLVGVHDGNTWTVTANSPSAFTIYDADWANARAWMGDDYPGTSTFDGGVDDVTSDPGYDFTCTASNWMIFGLDNAIFGAGNTVPVSALPGVWEVTVENTGTESMYVKQAGITNAWTAGFFQNIEVTTLAPGQKASLSVDLSAATSIEGLALAVQHLMPGAPSALSVKVTEPIPPVVDLHLLDVHWATATASGWSGDVGSTFDGGVNIAGDPGYEFTCTVAGWGQMFGVDSAVIGALTPDVWDVWVKNTSAVDLSFEQVAYTNGSPTLIKENGGGGTVVAPGATALFSWDLSAAGTIEKLGLTAGIAGSGSDVITFEVVEEPPPPPATIILTDAQWVLADALWGDEPPAASGTSTFDGSGDIAGDPGYSFTNTVYGWGMFFGLSSSGITGETWEVWVENTSAEQVVVKQGIHDGVNGWVYNDGLESYIDPGVTVQLTMDVSTNAALDVFGLFIDTATDGAVATISVVSEPLSPSEAYALWADDYPGMGGLADDDENGGLGDGLDNLTEYAFGGDPLVDDAATYLPASVFPDVDNWEYTYRRRADAGTRGLVYNPQFKTDLIYDTSWVLVSDMIAIGYEITESIVADGADFEVVTLSIPLTGITPGSDPVEEYDLQEAFLKLEITGSF